MRAMELLVLTYSSMLQYDFFVLQAWTGAKKCASVMKTCCAPAPISTISPKKYANIVPTVYEKLYNGANLSYK